MPVTNFASALTPYPQLHSYLGYQRHSTDWEFSSKQSTLFLLSSFSRKLCLIVERTLCSFCQINSRIWTLSPPELCPNKAVFTAQQHLHRRVDDNGFGYGGGKIFDLLEYLSVIFDLLEYLSLGSFGRKGLITFESWNTRAEFCYTRARS